MAASASSSPAATRPAASAGPVMRVVRESDQGNALQVPPTPALLKDKERWEVPSVSSGFKGKRSCAQADSPPRRAPSSPHPPAEDRRVRGALLLRARPAARGQRTADPQRRWATEDFEGTKNCSASTSARIGSTRRSLVTPNRCWPSPFAAEQIKDASTPRHHSMFGGIIRSPEPGMMSTAKCVSPLVAR
jgi:hypothetical protein